ncbi:MAG: right-handed parallel beta-helix repeat-containing protein, partial [Hyphomicrobiaceae bacterium]
MRTGTVATVMAGWMILTPAVYAEGSLKDAPTAKWHPWFEIGGYYNRRDDDGTGSFGTSRGETTAFVPITGGPRNLVFGQLTAKFFEDEAMEGNFAIGYRRMLPSGFNFGAWIGADVRDTEIDNTFWQLSGGFEMLSHDFDVRLNWYGPVTDPQTANADFAEVQLSGNQISMIGGEEVAMTGVDAEVGVRVPTGTLGFGPEVFELRVYGGGYYFDHDDAYEEIAGGKGRIELRVNDIFGAGSRLTTEYEISHDDVRDTRHEFGARVRIPLSLDGGAPTRLASLTPQERRMLDGLERDTDIITARSDAENVEDALTGTDFDRVAYAGDGGNITDTSASAGDNSLIVANGEFTGQQELQGNQTLVGGGGMIPVRGLKSGVVVYATAPGETAKLTNPGGSNDDDTDNNLKLFGSNTHVSGLTIIGDGTGDGDGIDLDDDKVNTYITYVDIRDVGGDGIDGDNRNYVGIFGVDIQRVGESGINFDDNNNVMIGYTMIRDVGLDEESDASRQDGSGIRFGDGNTAIIVDTSITNAYWDGIFFDDNSFDVLIENVYIAGVQDDGIRFYDGSEDIEIRNVAILNTGSGDHAAEGGDGIKFNDDAKTVTIANVAIKDAGGNGIYFDSDNTNVTIDYVGVVEAGDDGIYFNDYNTEIIVSRAIIRDPENDGIQFEDENENVTITDVMISGGTEVGIQFGDYNKGITIQSELWQSEITGFGGDGIEIGGHNTNVTITDVKISGADEEGIEFGDHNEFVAVENVAISDVDGEGIEFGDNNSGSEEKPILIRNVTITKVGEDGIEFGSDNTNVSIEDVDVADTGDDGIHFSDNNTDITISRVTITDPEKDGIHFKHENEDVKITDVQISGAGEEGILFGDDNRDIT